MTAEERLLEPWFAAARAEPADPPLALLSAILADAGEIGAERRAATAAPEPAPAVVVPAAVPALVEPPSGRRRAFESVGGWRGLTALAACAALGFWIGIAGQVTIEDGRVWSGNRAVAADAAPEDPVGAFFDLASAEG